MVIDKRKVFLAIITNPKNEVLVIRRKVKQSNLEWAFPGGMAEDNDTSEEGAVIREAREEVGLDVKVVNKLLERRHPNTYVEVVYYSCEMLNPKQEAEVWLDHEKEEIAELKWVSPQEALELFTSDVHPQIKSFLNSLSSSK